MINSTENAYMEEFSDRVVLIEVIFIAAAFTLVLVFLTLIRVYGEDARVRGYFVVQEFGVSQSSIGDDSLANTSVLAYHIQSKGVLS